MLFKSDSGSKGAMARKSKKPPAWKRLGKWLDCNRHAYPLDQDFAKAAGITPQRLSQILGGKAGGITDGLKIRFHELTAGAVPAGLWLDLAPASTGAHA